MKNNCEEWKDKIEDIVEHKNGIIQLIFFWCLLIFSGIFAMGIQSTEALIIELMGIVVAEVINLNIKDSITQRKLNNMEVSLKQEEGKLFRVADFDLTDFFENTKTQFYLSGIALNGILHNYKYEFEQLLREGKEVLVLMADPESADENAKLYHGISLNEDTARKNANLILHKQISTLDSIEEIDNIFEYIKSGQFKLRISNSVFSTSFVAYDIFENRLSKNDKQGKELKALFYQYKCTEPKDEPNIIVNSRLGRDWYLFFKKTIDCQWKDGKEIKSKEEFDNLRKIVNDKSNSYTI